MQFTILTSIAAFTGMAFGLGSAIVNVEASHGGAGSGLTNTTITVPIGPVYTNSVALDQVSTLYLVGRTDPAVPITTIECTPYKATDGTGSHGLPFSVNKPSRLSTNTVQVGSIVCKTSKGA
ncbi:hypothetical protein F4779DRAFT_407276 [Xylariaceae sp. FL0662B]|nr:hypothetical protein F4779DRAFT_407276 [Xylariaceae sp. FL0662B]